MKKILIITTGGTIDSAYDPAQGTPEWVPTPPSSAIPEALGQLGHKRGEDFDFLQMFHRDSKQINRFELNQIMHHLQTHPEYEKVMIVHGTDTLPRNGRYVSELLQHLSQGSHRIVFCGAMKPLRKQAEGVDGAKENIFLPESETDGWLNLRTAWQGLQSDEPGVFFTDGEKLQNPFLMEKSRTVEQQDGRNIVTHAEFIDRVNQKPDPAIDWVRET